MGIILKGSDMKSPWSDIGRWPTKEEWEEIKAWKNANKATRWRQGTIREDGLVFFHYHPWSQGGETWLTPEKFALFKEQIATNRKRYLASPEYREKHRAYCRMKSKEPQEKKRKQIYYAAYLRRNKWKCTQRVIRYQARLEGNYLPSSDPKKEAAVYRLAEALQKKTGVPHEVDHIIPLAAGGWNHHDNLQVLPLVVNREKHQDPFWTAPAGSGFKDWRDVPSGLWPDHLTCAYLQRLHDSFYLAAQNLS